jgi:hypothetical protein
LYALLNLRAKRRVRLVAPPGIVHGPLQLHPLDSLRRAGRALAQVLAKGLLVRGVEFAVEVSVEFAGPVLQLVSLT